MEKHYIVKSIYLYPYRLVWSLTQMLSKKLDYWFLENCFTDSDLAVNICFWANSSSLTLHRYNSILQNSIILLHRYNSISMNYVNIVSIYITSENRLGELFKSQILSSLKVCTFFFLIGSVLVLHLYFTLWKIRYLPAFDYYVQFLSH